jgi:hypothetical protein
MKMRNRDETVTDPRTFPTRDELPDSLWPVDTERLADHNPRELAALADRPQRLLPLPSGLPFPRQRQLQGLAQFGGRSPEGHRRSLGNLRRRLRIP